MPNEKDLQFEVTRYLELDEMLQTQPNATELILEKLDIMDTIVFYGFTLNENNQLERL